VDFFDLDSGGQSYDYFLHGNCDEQNIAPLETGFQNAAIIPERLRLPEPKGEIDPNSRKPGYGYQGFFDTKKHQDPPQVFVGHWQYKSTQSALTVYLASDGGRRSIWSGSSPSIRQAKENSAQVNKFFRRFYMQRVENPTGKVRFAAVMEPHKIGCSQIKNVTVPALGVVKITLEKRTDYIFCDLAKPQKIDGWSLSGKLGFLSLDQTGQVRDFYLYDGRISGKNFSKNAPAVLPLEISGCPHGDTFRVRDLSRLPEQYNPTVVLELPGEKSAWQFNIKSVDRQNNLVKLDRPHGLRRQAGKWVRDHYQNQSFAGKALLKVGLPERNKK